jgi:hypothetical protein
MRLLGFDSLFRRSAVPFCLVSPLLPCSPLVTLWRNSCKTRIRIGCFAFFPRTASWWLLNQILLAAVCLQAAFESCGSLMIGQHPKPIPDNNLFDKVCTGRYTAFFFGNMVGVRRMGLISKFAILQCGAFGLSYFSNFHYHRKLHGPGIESILRPKTNSPPFHLRFLSACEKGKMQTSAFDWSFLFF